MKKIKGIRKIIKTVKLFRRILLLGFIILTIVFISLHLFVNIKGKALIEQKLSIALNREVTIGSLSTSFPVNLHLKNIEAKGLLKIPQLDAGVGLFGVFRQRFALSLLKIVNPEVSLERKPLASVTPGQAPAGLSAQDNVSQPEALNLKPAASPLVSFPFPGLVIKHLIVSDGIFNFTDNISENQVIKIKVDKINLKADNLNFSARGNQITYFRLSGLLPWSETEEAGRIEADGWVNLFKKDMQATVNIQDIDGIYLYPYYSKWVDLEKARIEKAKLNLTSNIHGLDNDITANCHLELLDIVRKPRSPDEAKEKAEKIADAVIDIFRALNQGKIVLDFTIKTKMTKPQFGMGDVKSAVENKLTEATKGTSFQPEDALWFPMKILEGGVKSTAGVAKAFIDGSFAVGTELKRAVQGAFKREKEE